MLDHPFYGGLLDRLSACSKHEFDKSCREVVVFCLGYLPDLLTEIGVAEPLLIDAIENLLVFHRRVPFSLQQLADVRQRGQTADL